MIENMDMMTAPEAQDFEGQFLENPLLQEWHSAYETPPFSSIKMEDWEPAFEEGIRRSWAEVEEIIDSKQEPTFQNTILKLERQGELLNRVNGLFFNLLEADTSDEMEAIAERVQPKLVRLENDISLNPQLFERVKKVWLSSHEGLTQEDEKLLDDTYKSFQRAGADLDEEAKKLYRQYSEEVSNLSLKFSQNTLAATNAFELTLTDEKDVEEMPELVREGMAEEAQTRGKKGWTVTLQAPSVMNFLRYSSHRDLKEKVWRAYNSRAYYDSFDNSEIVKRMVNLRLKIARLLGYECYADYVLERRMAERTTTVNAFLEELLSTTKEAAVEDFHTVVAYARKLGFEGEFMPWDWAYYAEKYKEEAYAMNDALLKPYFELASVKKGVFLMAERLYGLTFTPNTEIETYHKDVTAYEVRDDAGRFMAILYLDFFPRKSKRGGAWMTEFRGAKIVDGKEQRPLVSLVMNFTKPTATTPSLLTFDEVETFLHEFGHSLHSILGEGSYESLTGTNVYRDFVELPSQLMENWATEKEFLDLWAKHYQTGEPIPEELVERIVKAKNFLAAYFHVRQLSFGKIDMAWHTLKEEFEGDVEAFEREAMSSTDVLPRIPGAVTSTAFGHIFAGGYAAGYYGYKWAEVLEADAFALFKERGIFNREVASKWCRELLSRGGTVHPMTLYVNFRGHKPETKALIDKILAR